ncbi:MAG: CPBP family intramembrane metalloprotease [Planctomycetaceae bacterium]|nr:CPBP family intramembrane metalloprotease [Planctomycetaceae bacterium]
MNEPESPHLDDEQVDPDRDPVQFSTASPENQQSVEEIKQAESSVPGPGFLESIGWTILGMLSQLVGSLIALIVMLVLYVNSSGLSGEQLQQKLQEEKFLTSLMREQTGLHLGITMGFFFLAVSTMVGLRLGSQRRRAIPFHFPSAWHIFLTVLWVLPLSLISGQLGLFAGQGWERLTEIYPSLQDLDGLNVMESIGGLIKDLPHWLVYLLIAVFPAVSEELLFRVLIGRGLVARYGVVAGIALTTLLFAAVHMHPVHMFALIPLSVAIHLSYLASRSIWVPMLAHFLNNAMAASLLLNYDPEQLPAGAGEEFLPWPVTLAAGVFCVMIGWMYWQTRLLPLNEEFVPESEPFVSADRPPLSLDACHFRWRFPSQKTVFAFALSMGFFVASMMSLGQ